jgi:hypothetical protein
MHLALVVVLSYVYLANGVCTHDKLSMPSSQTLEGAGTMMIHFGGCQLQCNMTEPQAQAPVPLVTSQSYDYETMNMVTRISQKMTDAPGGGVTTAETGAILNWKAGIMTMHSKTRFSGAGHPPVLEHCKTIKLPFFLRFLPIGQIMKKIKDIELSLFKCVGHHDDLDNFALDMEFPPKWVPKTMTSKMPRVKLAMDYDVDAAGLVKAMKLFEAISENRTKNNYRYHTESSILQDMVISKSRAGGPTEEDLKVPAEWGDCSTVHAPELEVLLAEWERSDSPFFGHNRVIPHTLRALMAEAKFYTVVV